MIKESRFSEEKSLIFIKFANQRHIRFVIVVRIRPKNVFRLIIENILLKQVKLLGVLIRSVNFVAMKKSTIWILGIIMGLSFLSLLYLQVSYIEEMVKMRKEQFNTSVRNALFQVSKDVEYDETQRWLLEDITEAERRALAQSSSTTEQKNGLIQQSERYRFKSPDGTLYSEFELKMITTEPSKVPKAMISRDMAGIPFRRHREA